MTPDYGDIAQRRLHALLLSFRQTRKEFLENKAPKILQEWWKKNDPCKR